MRRRRSSKKPSTRARAAPKAAAQKKIIRATSGRPWQLVLRALRGNQEICSHRIAEGTEFQGLADQWAYDLRNRRYWASKEEAIGERVKRARQALQDVLKFDAALLSKFASAESIEVQFAGGATNGSTAAHAVPWEYLLSAATRPERKGPLLITRRLDTGLAAPRTPPKKLLFIESSPGELAGAFDFSGERELAKHGLAFAEHDTTFSANPVAEEIFTDIQKGRPDVIHFAGFDTQQGSRLIGKNSRFSDKPGGILVRGPGRTIEAIDSAMIADTFATAKTRVHPQLVVFNCYNSAATLVADAVRGGASAAIGFQDYIDDEIAELFLAQFYREWRKTGWNIHQAFRDAWASLKNAKLKHANLHGTGIILLTTYSQSGLRLGRQEPRKSKLAISEQIVPIVQQRDEINYSLLHNNQPLFRKFSLNRIAGSDPIEVDVLVELNVGSDTYPYRYTAIINGANEPLTEDIKIPLTSEFARSLRDRVNSTLYVKINAGSQILYCRTLRVTLLPVDEWSDDSTKSVHDPSDRRAVWLPSFVLPRDPAVRQIIDDAQKYLIALSDDPAAGFDGYQQVEDVDVDGIVDDQVQAIWYAIVNDARLSYINPPPSYGNTTQRLRTPSDIVEGRRGTCIDLALLLAACLEYVEIYPAIILLKGHAFPAYWRSADAHDKFVAMFSQQEVGSASQLTAGPEAQTPVAETIVESSNISWAFENDKRKFKEIMNCIGRNELVPLETVWLTTHQSFQEAKDSGVENMSQPSEFEYLLDIMQARRHTPYNVTPLPLVKFGM